MDKNKTEAIAAPAATAAPATDAGSADKPEEVAPNGAANPVASSDLKATDKVAEPTDETAKNDAAEANTNVASADAADDKGEVASKKDEDVKAEGKPKDEAAQPLASGTGANHELPSYLANNIPLRQFFEALPNIVDKVGHGEMWGIELKDSKHIPTVNVLIKFLHANDGDIKLAIEQLTKALSWRKTNKPLELVNKVFDENKFKDLGFVTTYEGASGLQVVFTWNIYGAVENIKATFENVEEFLQWRVALMELAIQELKLDEATTVIDYNGEDPYQMIQVHDYKNVSFLRMDPAIRKASRETIEVFSMAYPELLKEKFFVNVPAVMGWVFGALKVFLSKKTIQKFHPISNGANLAREFDDFGINLPPLYGGKGYVLDAQGRAPRLAPKERAQSTTTTSQQLNDPNETASTKSKGKARASEDANPVEDVADGKEPATKTDTPIPN
ncbi:hypothetical protein VTO42DRAFT_6753 [Malbranchea cinnamomea]